MAYKKTEQYDEKATLALTKNYKEAISKFKSVKKKLKTNIKEFSLIDYHIGYCHFKLKEYNKAITAFKKLLKVNKNIKSHKCPEV